MQERIGTDQDGRELRLMDILESEPVDILEEMEQEKKYPAPSGVPGACAGWTGAAGDL